MINEVKLWWAERAPRERLLLGAMLLLLGGVVLWLCVVRPVEAGLVSVKQDYGAALDRNAAVRARVASLDKMPPRRGSRGDGAPLQQRLGQSASDAGFTLSSIQPASDGSVEISIASARPAAFFGWIARLESQGVSVRTLSAQPSGVGTISTQAVFDGR